MKTVTAVVVSNKMTKTVVVKTARLYTHPLYKKTIHRSSKLKAHTDIAVSVGDEVKLVSTRPLSKDVHYKISEIIKKAR